MATGRGPGLLPEDLDTDLPLPRTVELHEDERLEPPQHKLAPAHRHREALPEKRGAQVRVRIAPLAVGDARIVVPVAVALGDQALDESLEIVDQRALEL